VQGNAVKWMGAVVFPGGMARHSHGWLRGRGESDDVMGRTTVHSTAYSRTGWVVGGCSCCTGLCSADASKT
jgi:hypothetical protein